MVSPNANQRFLIIINKSATQTYRVGITAFKAFVNSEHVAFDFVKQCIEQDATDKCLGFVLDKFGIYIAFNEGKKD
ncbi:Hypothetical protein PHPALM_3132 [Phytophthora palmivora]|uniref:Uncharacterized protein n=1 Tax=Phytophthora palmivora TaxID=4796 RepID=A0A2P4YN96_9STRA|nr:Hypothetical protein PHPALM_3132 [Phytophthora palmivora]